MQILLLNDDGTVIGSMQIDGELIAMMGGLDKQAAFVTQEAKALIDACAESGWGSD